MSFPYVKTPGKLAAFLKQLPSYGVPDRLNRETLGGWGFKSSNHIAFVSVAKFVGLVDSSAVPTDRWKEARGNLGLALAKGVHEGYSQLFKVIPDAHRKDNEALRNFFNQHSNVGAQAVDAMVMTFKTLCDLADFNAMSEGATPAHEKSKGKAAPAVVAAPTGRAKTTTPDSIRDLAVNINVQLQVPPDSTGEVYDKFFAAMKKHLWPES